jgi:hypothetical protein
MLRLMRTAAWILLGFACVGFLLIASKLAVVGPCTDTFGALALLSVVVGTPLGLLLLALSAILSRRKARQEPFESSSSLRPS